MAPFTPITGEHLTAQWQQIGSGAWSVDDLDILVGRGTAGTERGLLVSEVSSRSIELHADVWLEDSGCHMALLRSTEPERPAWVSILPADLGTGGFITADGTYRTKLDPAAQRALKKNAWNDVRIRVAAGRLTVHLNGWQAIELALESDHKSDIAPEYQVAFATPEDDSEIRWRYVRIRTQGSADEPMAREPK